MSGGNRKWSKNLREHSDERKSKKSSAAERSAEREVVEWVQSGERRSQKWEREAAKKPAPLRSNALHRSNRVSADKITTGILHIRFNRVFAQSAVRQYNNQTVYLIGRNTTVLVFRL